jgi:hypothetical protein
VPARARLRTRLGKCVGDDLIPAAVAARRYGVSDRTAAGAFTSYANGQLADLDAGQEPAEAAGIDEFRRLRASLCDIDLDSGAAIIAWQLQQYDGHVVLCPSKTAHSERIVALDRTTVAALRAHRWRPLAERAAAAEVFSTAVTYSPVLAGTPWLLTGCRATSGSSTPPAGCRRSACRTCAAAPPALPKWAAGADHKVAQDMLGHSSIVLTADTYTSVLPGSPAKWPRNSPP